MTYGYGGQLQSRSSIGLGVSYSHNTLRVGDAGQVFG